MSDDKNSNMFAEKRKEKLQAIQDVILRALDKAPIREGFTVRELASELQMPQPTTRWHLELLEAGNNVESTYIGRNKLYKIASNKQRE